MSHKSEINCAELKNKKYLTQALQSLGFIFN
jgi:hypothetical protein